MTGVYWLASYPKSGNTWLRALVHSIRAGGAEVDINSIAILDDVYLRAQFDLWSGVAASDLTSEELLAWRAEVFADLVAALDEPLYAKTHDCRFMPGGRRLIPEPQTLGAIYLVRDPRDIVPSLARHLMVDIDKAIDVLSERGRRMSRSEDGLRPKLANYWGSWSENVQSWMGAADFPRRIIRYEDLRADPTATIKVILPVLGIEASGDIIERAVCATALDKLRAQEAQVGFREAHGVAFFGEGEVGGWRRKLTKEQAGRVEDAHGPTMRCLGYLV